jgi:L-fuconolactonase
MRTVDAHVHLWNRQTDPQPWIDPATMHAIDRDFGAAELEAMLRETRIDRAILVQSSNSPGETIRLLQLAADTEAIAGVVGWLDLTADVTEQLEGIPAELRTGLVGVRHLVHIDPDERWLERADVNDGLAALGRAGLTFDLVIRWWQLPLAVRTVQRHPGTVFVLDHLGGVPAQSDELAGWESGIRELAAADNVTAKLSGISGLFTGDADAPDLGRIVATVFDAFGAHRLMFGSDWPLVQLAAGAAQWRTTIDELLAARSPEERLAVLSDTAVRSYGIDIS